MITTHFKKLMAVVICLLTELTAQAQLTATFEPYAATDWNNQKPVNFKLTEVAQALQTDTTTLVAALNSWTAEGSTDANMVFLTTTEGQSDNYTQGGKGGFWVNADGMPQAWSDDNTALRWYNTIGWDSAEDLFTITIGQYPGQCAVGDTFKPKFVLKLGDKEATIEITINIMEKPVVSIPEPKLTWKDLTIVDDITKDVEQKVRSGYDSDKVEVNLTEALVKLGISDANLVQDELKQLLFAKKAYMTDDVVMGAQLSDSLTNESSANGIGFWMRAVSDEEGEETPECACFAYDGSDKFYMEAFTFDAETGILSCNLGQYPNNLKAGKTYYTYIYIVYGDKAIRILYNLIVPEQQLGTLADYEKAGESTMKVEMEPMESYDTKNFSIDIETITTALGCAVGEIDDFYMLDSDVDFAGKNQEGVGYWVGIDGAVIAWGDNAMFYVTPKADDFSKFGIGQYPGHMNVGDSARATIYFLANSKYYQLGIDLVIVEPKQVDVVFESVAQRSVEVQQVPGDYVWTSGMDIPEAWVEEQIGTADWTLYALATLNEDGSEKEGNAKYSKSYTCTPYPGFWMDADGRNVGWNQTPTRVGITVASPEGKFSLMQHPGVTLGDVFRFPIFLVNEENGKMVTFNFTYSIVESVVEIKEVGSEDIVIPVSNSEEGEATTIDLAKAAEALGITVDALVEGKFLQGMTADGTYGAGVNIYDGLSFDAKGASTMVEADVLMYFSIEANEDGKTGTLTTYNMGAVADDFSAMGVMCFLVEGKRYVYNVRFVSAKYYTDGIAENPRISNLKSQTIYDLQGRKIEKATRGLYILNGRKYIVK